MRTLLVATTILVATTAALADPATTKDLVGHKICWTTVAGSFNPAAASAYSVYSAGGKYYNSWWGNGTYTIANGAFHTDTPKGSYDSQLEKLPNGSFKSTMSPSTGGVLISSGRYCK
jgi:hypothetical protein